MVLKKLRLSHFGTNCYIYADETTKKAVVIDPAAHGDKIADELDKLGYKAKYIIITHAHIDHMMGLDELKSRTGAMIAAGYADSDNVNSNSGSLAEYFHTQAPKSTVDIRLRDGDELLFSGNVLTIIETPGHTPGGICIYCRNENVLFSGDTLFNMSVGRTDFPGGSMKSLSDSIRNKLFTLPDETMVYPGHNDDTTIKFEKENEKTQEDKNIVKDTKENDGPEL